MKKTLALILVLLMIPGACLAFNDTGYPICDEVITLTVSGLNSNGGGADWNETNMVAEIESRFGIRLDCTSFQNDTWKTQLTLMLAEDALPDIILNPGISLAEVATYGEQGYFLDMGELIEQYAPNIVAMNETYPMFKLYNTSPDGGVYTLTQIVANPIALAPRCWLNKVWMDNLGLAYPKTVEELYDVLKAFKEQDANGNGDANDEIPLDGNNEDNISTFINAFGFNTRSRSYLLQADEAGKVYLGETTDAFKAYLTYMKRLWDDGLMCGEFFTEPGEQFNAQFAADTVGMAGAPAPFVSAGQEIDYDANFYWIGALTSEYEADENIVLSGGASGMPWVLVNANTQYPKEIVRLLDYFFTEEGQVCGNQGFEGVDYDYNEVTIPGLEGYKTFTMRCPDGFSSAEEYRNKKAIINNGFYFVKPLVNSPSYVVLAATTDEQYDALLPANGWMVQLTRYGLNREGVSMIDRFPTLVYSSEEAEERTQLYTDINAYLSTMQAQFITGQTDIEAGWEDFIAQLSAMKLDRLIEIEQAAYDRLMGK